MTARDVYEATIIEINKEDSQSFTIEEFNYILNKAILAFVNEKYNFYAVNQQTSDDLRTLVKSQTFNIHDTISVETGDDVGSVFNPTTSYLLGDITSASTATLSSLQDINETSVITFGELTTQHPVTSITGNNVEFTNEVSASNGDVISVLNAPIIMTETAESTPRTVEVNFSSSDYLHLISCRVIWKNKRPRRTGSTQLVFPAKRLTFDMLNAIQNNTYLNPAPNRPYYQLFDHSGNSGVTSLPSNLVAYKAHQNRPRIKIHVGNINEYMELRSVVFDYIKIPETVTLHDSDVFSAVTDSSQVLELPDYLINEVVKRCTGYLLEKSRDPRMQTQPVFNQEIPKVPINMTLGGQVAAQQE